ncbi:MAG: hypothetical protein FJW31_12195 [Acidobacteria bacterium]|nr:hypothetical protein [Acidobacteriota bacterium]
MSKTLLPVAALLCAPLIQAQSVGTSVRTLTLAPEEMFVEMVISKPNDMQLEEAVSHLAALKIGQQDLHTVGTLKEDVGRLGWEFSYIRPYTELPVEVRQLEALRRQLREKGIPLQSQFFLRPAARTLAAAKRKVLIEMLAEARHNAGSSAGKIRSVSIEPQPEHIDSGRNNSLFGQQNGALQYNFAVIVVFDQD